jgi:general secretion pathway protein A
METSRPQWSPASIFTRPAADDIWPGPAQQAALSHLFQPHAEKFLLGPPSSGKSTLLRHFEARMPEAAVLRSHGPKRDGGAVLAALLTSAKLAPWELADIDQRNLLTVFVAQRRAQDKHVVLLFDDVDHYEPAAREELDRLRELHARDLLGHALIMAGDESSATLYPLAPAPGAAAAAVHCLPTASDRDIADYLRWRLTAHGLDIEITPTAARLLHRFTAGRYAGVNVLFQMTLLLFRERGAARVDAQLVQAAAKGLAERHRAPHAAAAAPAGPPPGHVLITRDGSLLERRPLAARLLVGRSEHNDVCLASPYLSRHHAAIVGTPEGYYVVDLHSANGMTLRGKRVARAVLHDGDVLGIGPFRLKILLKDPIAWGDPLPDAESLVDTAILPQRVDAPPLVRRVK